MASLAMAATLGSSRQASARLRSTFAMRDETFASRPGSCLLSMASQLRIRPDLLSRAMEGVVVWENDRRRLEAELKTNLMGG